MLMMIWLFALSASVVWNSSVSSTVNGGWTMDYPRGLHVKENRPTEPAVLLQHLHMYQIMYEQNLFLTCPKTYGSYFLIQQPLAFLSASLACQSMGALLATIVSENNVGLLNLYTWCSIGTQSTLYPWVSGNSVAGSCPILTSNPTNSLDFTTTVGCNLSRGALCQLVSQQIASFSTSTTFTTSEVTVSATLSLTSTLISTLVSTITSGSTLMTTVTVTSTSSSTLTRTSTVVVVTSTSSTTGVFPSPTTTTVSGSSVADTETSSVTGILVTVTTVTRSTTTYSNSPVLTQFVCPFIVNPSQSNVSTV